jgi:hypothetical protein
MDTVGVSDSSPLVADSLVDVSVLLDDGAALVPEVAEVPEVDAEGVVDVADVSAVSLAAVDGAVVSGVVTAVLGAVVVTGACSAVVTSASVGSAGATVVTGGATVVGGATVASAVAVAVASGRGTCGITGAGASAGACGASSTGAVAVSSGSGTTTVVVASVPSPRWATAGAIPPVSAVREITMPDASTATTPRFEQISRGVPTFTTPSVIEVRFTTAARNAFTPGGLPGNRSSRTLRSQKVHRWPDRGVTHRPGTRAKWNRGGRLTWAVTTALTLVACGFGSPDGGREHDR